MGQAKLKAVRKPDKESRKGTSRLQSIKIEGQVVSYDDKGRAKQDGSGSLEPIFLMEADIPELIFNLIRKKYPKLDIVTVYDASAEGESDGTKSKLAG